MHVTYQAGSTSTDSGESFKSPEPVPLGRGANNSCPAGMSWDLKCRSLHRALVVVIVWAVHSLCHFQDGLYCAKGKSTWKFLTSGLLPSSYSMMGSPVRVGLQQCFIGPPSPSAASLWQSTAVCAAEHTCSADLCRYALQLCSFPSWGEQCGRWWENPFGSHFFQPGSMKI